MSEITKILKVEWEAGAMRDGARLHVLRNDEMNFFIEDIVYPYTLLPVLHIRFDNGVVCITEKRSYILNPYDFWLLVYPDVNEDVIALRLRAGAMLALLCDVYTSMTPAQQGMMNDLMRSNDGTL